MFRHSDESAQNMINNNQQKPHKNLNRRPFPFFSDPHLWGSYQSVGHSLSAFFEYFQILHCNFRLLSHSTTQQKRHGTLSMIKVTQGPLQTVRWDVHLQVVRSIFHFPKPINAETYQKRQMLNFICSNNYIAWWRTR